MSPKGRNVSRSFTRRVSLRASEHFKAEKIFLIGEVGPKMFEDLMKQIKDFDQKANAVKKEERKPFPKDLHVVLATTGGMVAYGKAVYDTLRMLGRRSKLSLVVNGLSYSMGSSVMMAVPLERRFITASGSIMVHEARRDVPGLPHLPATIQLAWLKETIVGVERTQSLNEWTIKTIAKGSGNSKEQVREWFEGGRYFDAKEAIEAGFVSDIIR